jgi:SAM-dependent methyltransferase
MGHKGQYVSKPVVSFLVASCVVKEGCLMAKKKGRMAYLPENALNAICPYFTMFPLEYPIQKLKKHRKQQPVVMDPFCGRGTTLFAARKLKMKAWGIDTSPIAVAIAKAKLARCTKESAIMLAEELIGSVAPFDIPDTPFFRAAYCAFPRNSDHWLRWNLRP